MHLQLKEVVDIWCWDIRILLNRKWVVLCWVGCVEWQWPRIVYTTDSRGTWSAVVHGKHLETDAVRLCREGFPRRYSPISRVKDGLLRKLLLHHFLGSCAYYSVSASVTLWSAQSSYRWFASCFKTSFITPTILPYILVVTHYMIRAFHSVKHWNWSFHRRRHD